MRHVSCVPPQMDDFWLTDFPTSSYFTQLSSKILCLCPSKDSVICFIGGPFCRKLVDRRSTLGGERFASTLYTDVFMDKKTLYCF
jgi:hypothetical protein